MSKFQFSDAALSLIGEAAAFVVVVAIVVILAMLRVRPKKVGENVTVEVSQTSDIAASVFDPHAFVCDQVAHMLAEDRKNIAEGKEPSFGALTFPPTGYYHRFGYSLMDVRIAQFPPPDPDYELVIHCFDRNEGSPRRYYSVLYRMR